MEKYNLAIKMLSGALLLSALVVAGGQFAAAWPKAPTSEPSPLANPYKNIEILAQAAVVYDPDSSSILYAKNAYTPLPLASLTKVMTALVAANLASTTPGYLAVNDQSLKTEGDSGLLRDETWSIKKLADFTLVSSSNDGAAALALIGGEESVFVDEMNKLALSLSLSGMKFFNPTGLDLSSGQAGAYGSALDMARLFTYILKTEPDLLAATGQAALPITSENNLSHLAVNTNELAGRLPGLFASKTGFTDAAGGNLAVAVDTGLNRPIIVVVLGSTEEGRFADVQKLITAAESDSALK